MRDQPLAPSILRQFAHAQLHELGFGAVVSVPDRGVPLGKHVAVTDLVLIFEW